MIDEKQLLDKMMTVSDEEDDLLQWCFFVLDEQQIASCLDRAKVLAAAEIRADHPAYSHVCESHRSGTEMDTFGTGTREIEDGQGRTYRRRATPAGCGERGQPIKPASPSLPTAALTIPCWAVKKAEAEEEVSEQPSRSRL
jgi:hypothetical protein